MNKLRAKDARFYPVVYDNMSYLFKHLTFRTTAMCWEYFVMFSDQQAFVAGKEWINGQQCWQGSNGIADTEKLGTLLEVVSDITLAANPNPFKSHLVDFGSYSCFKIDGIKVEKLSVDMEYFSIDFYQLLVDTNTQYSIACMQHEIIKNKLWYPISAMQAYDVQELAVMIAEYESGVHAFYASANEALVDLLQQLKKQKTTN